MTKAEFRKFIEDKPEAIRIEWRRADEPMSAPERPSWKTALLKDMEDAGRLMVEYGDMPDA